MRGGEGRGYGVSSIGEARRRKEGKEGCPSRAQWQPSTSRVQGRTCPLRIRFPSSVMDDDVDDESLGMQKAITKKPHGRLP